MKTPSPDATVRSEARPPTLCSEPPTVRGEAGERRRQSQRSRLDGARWERQLGVRGIVGSRRLAGAGAQVGGLLLPSSAAQPNQQLTGASRTSISKRLPAEEQRGHSQRPFSPPRFGPVAGGATLPGEQDRRRTTRTTTCIIISIAVVTKPPRRSPEPTTRRRVSYSRKEPAAGREMHSPATLPASAVAAPRRGGGRQAHRSSPSQGSRNRLGGAQRTCGAASERPAAAASVVRACAPRCLVVPPRAPAPALQKPRLSCAALPSSTWTPPQPCRALPRTGRPLTRQPLGAGRS